MSLWILVAAIVWLLASPRVSQRIYERWLFLPHKQRGDASAFNTVLASYGGREFTFANRRGHKLHGCVVGKTQNAPFLMFYSMGKDGDIARRADVLSLLLQAGIPIFIYEYSGFGKSEGRPSLQGVCDDALDAFRFASYELGFSESQIILYGESLGTAITGYMLNHVEPAGVILKSGFATFQRVTKECMTVLRLYPSWMFPMPRLDTSAALGANTKPVLVIHGDGDRMARRHHGRMLFEAANEPRRLVRLPNSRHAYTPPLDQLLMIATISQFVASLSRSKRTTEHASPVRCVTDSSD